LEFTQTPDAEKTAPDKKRSNAASKEIDKLRREFGVNRDSLFW
jgi:hypothetical protein